MIDAKQARIYETKLQPPQISANLFAHESLNSRLMTAAHHGQVVTVIAPAGSGKSTLLAQHHQAVKDAGFATHWLSLDRTNDDPRNFAMHLIRALGRAGDNVRGVLRFDASDDAGTLFQQLLATIANRSEKIAIFFDDFHTISSPLISDFISTLIAHLPSNTHLVLASRSRLNVDISRRRLAGTLLEVSATDLNLNLQQMQHMLHNVHQLELSSKDAKTLLNTTEGWMAGTQLAAISIKSSPYEVNEILQGLSAQNTDLKEYLFSAVIDGLRPEIRDFLISTAPLSKMCVSLCDATHGITNSNALINEILSSNLFLIPLDRHGKWYRYHHLFSEFLENELFKKHPKKLNEVRRNAAAWSEKNGYLTDAIQYYLESGDHSAAAELINTHVQRVALDNGDHLKILDWMRRLPHEFQHNNPDLMINQAWSRAFSRDAVTAKSLCMKAMSLLADPDVEKRYSATEFRHLQWYGEVVDTLSDAALEKILLALEGTAHLLEKIPEQEIALRASVLGTRACCMLIQRQFAAASSTGAQQYKLGRLGDVIYSIIWGLYFTGVCNIELGRLRAAVEVADQARQCLIDANGGGPYTQSLSALLRVEVAVQHCHFEQAEQLLSEHNILSTIAAPIDLLIRAYKSDARQLAWRGSLTLARQTLHHAQEIGLSNKFPRLYVSMAAEEVALQLIFDDLPSSLDTVRRTDLLNTKPDSKNREVAAQIREVQRITEARIMLASNQNTEASQLLYKLLRSANHCDHQRLVIHLRALRSTAIWALGEHEKAIRELDKAISAATPENLLYPLASAGAKLLPVLDEIISRRGRVIERDTEQKTKREFETRLRQIISDDKHEQSGHETRPAALEPTPDQNIELTSRELDILRLIAAGLNNKELADELFISVSTAKWHLQNIFGKLEVRNRTAAIAIARKNQLI